MDIRAPVSRIRAALAELRLDVRVRISRRRERRALARLGAAAVSGDVAGNDGTGALLSRISAVNVRLEGMAHDIGRSLAADRADFATVAGWMRPVIVLRGLCSRGVLRHQSALHRRGLTALHASLGEVLAERDTLPSLSQEMAAVSEARAELHLVLEERSERLAPYGGSALPPWVPHLDSEFRALGRAVWLQVRDAALPRSPALVGLAVGWWVANTYTDSQFSSVMHSLGIGDGGRRVVDRDTYSAMAFWLPVLSAGVCAYLADRARFVVQRRYAPPAETPANIGPT